MAKLDFNKVSLASGITAVILFVLCYILFIGTPGFMYTMGSRMFHGIQMANNFVPSFGGFLLGLVYSFIVGLVIGGIFSWIYNMLSKK